MRRRSGSKPAAEHQGSPLLLPLPLDADAAAAEPVPLSFFFFLLLLLLHQLSRRAQGRGGDRRGLLVVVVRRRRARRARLSAAEGLFAVASLSEAAAEAVVPSPLPGVAAAAEGPDEEGARVPAEPA